MKVSPILVLLLMADSHSGGVTSGSSMAPFIYLNSTPPKGFFGQSRRILPAKY